MSVEMRPAVFLDRDGVLCEERSYITALSQLNIFPYTKQCVKEIHEKGYLAICITNQSAVARGLLSEQTLKEIHAYLMRESGLDAIYYCPHHPEGKVPYRMYCSCRKPHTGLIDQAAAEWDIDLSRSYLVGDRASDILCGKRAGLKTILVESGYGSARLEQQVTADAVCTDLRAAVQTKLL